FSASPPQPSSHPFPYTTLFRSRLPRDHPAADRGLDGHLEELARDDRAQLLDERLALIVRLVAVDDDRQRVDGLAVEQDVELDEIDRESKRLNSSHQINSYAVFC